MWPKLGFTKQGERLGRSRAGHTLVTWWRTITAPSLFDLLTPDEDGRLLVALDSEIFRQIYEDEDIHDLRALTAAWVEEFAEVVITEDVAAGLSTTQGGGTMPTEVHGYRVMRSDSESSLGLLRALQFEATQSPHKYSLLTTVSQASVAGATYLLTHDTETLRLSGTIERLTGLEVLRPTDFLLQLQSHGGEREYRTRVIAASGLSISKLVRLPSDAELKALCCPFSHERFTALRSRVNSIMGRRSGRLDQLVTADKCRLALAASYRADDRVTVTVLRSGTVQDGYTYIRQLVHHLRDIAARAGPSLMSVYDDVGTETARALADEGFRKDGGVWTADIRTSIHRADDSLPPELNVEDDVLTPQRVSVYEKRMWPSKVFVGVVLSYVVPIRPEYARVLLGYEERQGRLFEEHQSAAAARENVYYRSPRRMVAPARLLWWVSGGGSTGGMRALSWLDSTDSGDPQRLHGRYRHRGVLSEQHVVSRAYISMKSGEQTVTALLFSRTEVFSRPIPLARARELDSRMQTPGYFQSMKEIGEESVLAFYEEGMRYDE